jgi:hypothetical protein
MLAAEALFAFVRGPVVATDREMVGALLILDLMTALKG